MRKEGKSFYRSLANGLLVAALIGTAGLPIINHHATGNVIAAERGLPLDCPKPAEAKNGLHPFDAIAVLGAGMAIQKDTNSYGPNTFEKGRLTAAALLYLAGYSDTVVLHIGKQKSEIDPHLEVQYLQEKVMELSHNTVSIPEQAIIMETDSVNTASSLQISKEQIEEHGWGNILYVSDEFHLAKRVPVIACEYGISGSYLSVEEIYAMYNPEGINALKKRNKGQGMAWRVFMEEVKMWSMIFDPYQHLSIQYKTKTVNTR